MLATGHRLNTILLVLILLVGLAILGVVATRSDAGPLDPPGAPASTGIPIDEAGSWSRALSDVGGCNSPRFKCVMPTAAQPTGEAVLDRETGLVWQRQVSSLELVWVDAVTSCLGSSTGNRLGWRLPTFDELHSLSDTDGDGVWAGMPLFPGGVANREYWTHTTFEDSSDSARLLDYDNTLALSAGQKVMPHGYWCVRGASPGEQ